MLGVVALVASFLAFAGFAPPASAAPIPGIITTFAGNIVASGPATAIGLQPDGIAVRGTTVYVAAASEHVVRRFDTVSGQQHVVAGSGGAGYGGDGGAATAATLYQPRGVAVDAAGNVYIADTSNNVIRKVTVATGVITTVAGTGTFGFGGDGGAATAANLAQPYGVAVAPGGDLYVADTGNHRIRKVTTATGVITTIAGTAVAGSAGDGGPATAAQLNGPTGVAFDSASNLFIADGAAHRVRRVAASGATITTFAGTGAAATSGDGGPASAAAVNRPSGVAVDATNNVYIAETNGNRVRVVSVLGSAIATVAGTGNADFSGDGGPATLAHLAYPTGVAVGGSKVFVADTYNNRVRAFPAAGGTITTVAGNGITIGSGNGGPAWNAQIGRPMGLAADTKGNVFVAADADRQVRKISSDGTISVLAGSGTEFPLGDGGPATAASLRSASGVAVDTAGNVYIADGTGNRIRKVTASTGIITTVAGNGNADYLGDGGPATDASLYNPVGIAVDAGNNLYIADSQNHRVRFVNAVTNIITTIAGTGTASYSGDGGPAIGAALNRPQGLALDTTGKIVVADGGNNRVRRFSLGGNITTIVGNGTGGSAGDGGLATAASIYNPIALAVDAANTVYVAESYVVRSVAAGSGIIDAFAGTGTRGSSGNGVPATAAQLGVIQGLAVDKAGTVFLSDWENDRVRRVDVAGPGAMFHPYGPTRLLDSRTTTGGWNAKLAAGAPRSLLVANPGGPIGNATAVVLNVTATNSTTGSFVSVWPTGSPPPNSSNLNFGPNQTIANLVTVRVGNGGRITFANAVGALDVVADLVGYYDNGLGTGDLFRSVAPSRILDSRGTNGGWNAPLTAGAPKDLAVRGHGGVPATATSVVANVTATASTAGSFLTVWPSGAAKPNTSTVNFAVFQTIPNLVVMPLGANGNLTIANEVGSVHVIVDVLGYFDPTAGGARFHSLVPNRILDSRYGIGLPYGIPSPWTAGSTKSLLVAGTGVIPANATGVVMNVTATQGTAGSFVTVFPHGLAKPTSSNLNFGPNETIPNLVMVGIGGSGQVDIANELGSVHLVADAVGYFAAA